MDSCTRISNVRDPEVVKEENENEGWQNRTDSWEFPRCQKYPRSLMNPKKDK